MPASYTNDYEIADWTSGNFTGPLTGGSSGFINSTGAVFIPSGETGGTGVNTWIDTLGADELTVDVSCQTPNTSSTGGWVGLVDEYFAAIVGQSTDMSGGGTKTVVLDTSSVDWTTVRGLQVKSGDASTEHEFTLHSSSFTSASAELTISGSVPLGGSATILAESRLTVSGDVPLGGLATILRTPIFSVHDGYFLGGGATFDTPVALFVANSFTLGGSAILTVDSGLSASGEITLGGTAEFYAEPVLSAGGSVRLSGGATLFSAAILSASGKLRLGGTSSIIVGTRATAWTGAIPFSGGATLAAGRAVSGTGKVSLGGSAQFKHAVSLSAYGPVALGGSGAFAHISPRTLSVAGPITVSGGAYFYQPKDEEENVVFARSRTQEVFVNG
jgi:hypothetical protein